MWIFEAVRVVLRATGVLSGKTRRELDSVVLDAVATQDTVTQLIAVVRRVRRQVPGAAELIAKHCHAHDWDDAGKPRIAWDDQAARDALVSALVGDAHTITEAFAQAKLDPQRRRRWDCWRWWPGRTWNPPRAATAPTGGGASPT
jgi:hypothetical protein